MTVYSFMFGSQKCSDWGKDNQTQVSRWALDYWSYLENKNSSYRLDSNLGILQSVADKCRSDPSLLLHSAVENAFSSDDLLDRH